MSFSEQFPSLENRDLSTIIPNKVFSLAVVQEFCLDKQKVRDTIEKLREEVCLCDEEVNFKCLYCDKINNLYKELGL